MPGIPGANLPLEYALFAAMGVSGTWDIPAYRLYGKVTYLYVFRRFGL